jgi:alkylation response protein AidB-like acyl-CoA dehydrogenase
VDGDDIVLSGAKAYVEAGAQADMVLVTARSESGLTQVLVPKDVPGVSVVPGTSIDFVRRFAEIHFDSVRLPKSALVGEAGGADEQVGRQICLAILLQCAETNGAIERAMEFTVDYMRQRYAFGRPIASYQALKHRLADMLMWVHGCMATTDAALTALDAGAPDAAELTSIAKSYVGFKSFAVISDLGARFAPL